MNIKVLHVQDYREQLRNFQIHLYCGRIEGRYPMHFASLGNPFHMRAESERNKVCREYEKMLKADPTHPHWKTIKRIAKRAAQGYSIALYCHCSPKKCHCDTIKQLAIKLAKETPQQ